MVKRLRVLFVCPYLPALGTSAGNARMFRVIQSASEEHDVSVLCYYESPEELVHLPSLREFCQVDAVCRGQSLDDWRRDPLHLIPRPISLEFGNPLMRRKLDEALFSESYDLCNLEYCQMAYLLPKRPPLPTVLTHHEVQHRVAEQWLRAAPSFPRLIIWLRLLHYELDISRRVAANVFFTENEAASLLRFLPDLRYAVNNTGVDCAYFQPLSVPAEPNSLVYMGYFRHQPNVDAVRYFVRQVLPRIWAQNPEVTLSVVGGWPPEEIVNLGADPRIRVTGWVEDYRPYLAAASAFVVPVVSGAGIRGKVTEAWSMEKAVVTTPLGAEGLRAVDGENLLIAHGPAAFADQVLALLASPTLQARLGAGGRRTALAFYDWSVTTREYGRIFQETVEAFGGAGG